MSDYERETQTSTPSGDAYQRERTTVDDTPDRVVVQRSSNAGAWLLAALVAIIAIIAVVWMMTSRTSPTNEEIAAAMDQSRAAGYVEGASTAMSNLPQPTLPAPSIDTGSAIASQTAADAARAASEARAAAERAADSAQNAANNVSANVSGTTTNTTVNATTP